MNDVSVAAVLHVNEPIITSSAAPATEFVYHGDYHRIRFTRRITD